MWKYDHMKPRRILIFSLVYYPRFIGGAEVAVKEITDRISPNEVEFDMVTLRKHAPAFERIGNVNVHRVGLKWRSANTKSFRIFPLSKYLFAFTAYRAALKLHRQHPYDAIWPIMANYAGFAALFFKMRHPEVPMVLTLQEGDPFNYIKRRVGPFYPLFKRIFTRADRIQAISNYLADWAKDMDATCPIAVVPNAVDVQLFSNKASDGERIALKEKLGKKEGDIFLITTSRLVTKNAVGNVIEALKSLPANVKFLILGTGHLERELKQQTADLKLEDRVKFLGFIPHTEMPKYLQISDMFIRPSLSEGLGNSFLEAMAAGIPVIATPVGGIPDFLKDGETGLFCEVNNPASIAQKVQKLIKDKESRDYIIKNARVMVNEKYQWEKIAGEMKDILLHPVK